MMMIRYEKLLYGKLYAMTIWTDRPNIERFVNFDLQFLVEQLKAQNQSEFNHDKI